MRPSGTGRLAGAAAVALFQIHPWHCGKTVLARLNGHRCEGAALDANRAFPARRQKADVQIHPGRANDALALFSQGKPRDGATGTDLIATTTIFPAVVLFEPENWRQPIRQSVISQVGLNDARRTSLRTVAASKADTAKLVFVNPARRTQGRRWSNPRPPGQDGRAGPGAKADKAPSSQ